MGRMRTPGPLRPAVGVVRLVRRRKRRATQKAAEQRNADRQQARDLAVLAALAQQSGASIDLGALSGKIPTGKPAWHRAYLQAGGHRAIGSVWAVALGLDVTWLGVHYLPGGWMVGVGKALVALAWMVGAVLWLGSLGGGANRRIASSGVVLLSAVWVGLPAGPVELPARWMTLVLVAVVASVARGWHFRARPVTEETRAARKPRQTDQARTWDEYLGAEKKAIAGTRLEGVEVKDTSWSATVVCPRDSQGAQLVVSARERIATAFGVSPLWVEVIRTSDNSRPRVVVTTEATLAESRPWTPAGVTATTVEVGTRPDGTRVVAEVQRPESGVRHWWFTGGSGSGKTAAVIGTVGRIMQPHVPALEATGEKVGWVVLDLVDLGETSLPALADDRVRFRFGTTVEDCRLALQRAVAVMESRQHAMRSMRIVDRGVERVGVSTLQVGPEYPLYLLLIEEATGIIGDKQSMLLAQQVAKLGRKYGVSLAWVTQTSSLNEAFGPNGGEAVRMNIQANGSVWAGWSNRGSGQMAFGGGVQINLAEIPKGQPGTGLWVTQGGDRCGVSRTDWIDDSQGRPDSVPSMWQVADTIVPGGLEAAALVAVEEVEAAAVQGSGEGGEVPAVRLVEASSSVGDRRALVAGIVEDLAAEGPVRTSEVMVEFLARTGDAGLQPTDPEWGKIYDRVLKDLGQVAAKTSRGQWERKAA